MHTVRTNFKKPEDKVRSFKAHVKTLEDRGPKSQAAFEKSRTVAHEAIAAMNVAELAWQQNVHELDQTRHRLQVAESEVV